MLKRLKQLNLAENKIEKIGEFFFVFVPVVYSILM